MAAVVITLIAACSFNLRTVLAVIGGAGTQLEETLSISPAILGSVSTISILGIAAGSVAANHVSRRLGLWRAVQLSLVGTSLALGLLLTENLWTVMASVGLSGFFAGATGALLPTVIRRFLTPNQRGLGVSTMMTLTSVGSLIASVLIGWSVASWDHWRPATLVLFGLSLIFAMLWTLASTVRTPHTHISGPPADGANSEVPPTLIRTRAPRWVLYLTAYFTVQSAMVFAQIAWLVPTLREWNFSAAQTATVFSVITGLQVIGGFAVPLLAQRSARPTAMLWAMALLVSGGTVGLMLSGRFAASFALLVAITLLLATGHGGVFAIVNYVLSSHSKDTAATTRNTAFTMGLSQLLGAGGPALFGLTVDAWGFTVSWVALGAFGLALPALTALLVRSLKTTGPTSTLHQTAATTGDD